MKKTLLIFACFILATISAKAQNKKQVWDSIKNNSQPTIMPAFQNEYDAAYIQPLADYGWEDGLQISPDGLNLYALYSPMDLLLWSSYFFNHLQEPFCNLVGNMSYMRPYANNYGMDLQTNSFGCDSFANIDILYAHRNTVTDSFTTWQLSGVARAGAIEGSPAPLYSQTDPGKVDLFMFTSNSDIWMIKNTTANPSEINNAIRLPSPINPVTNEFNADNAFLERIDANTIILIYEKYTDANTRTFMYTMSSDTGTTWNTPQPITTINNSLGHIEHPCLYKDNTNQWWLYFSIDYTYISRAKQLIAGNWDSWDTPENIISKGNALSLGEPTVTQNGDISFSLAYTKIQVNDSTDVYDLDPWFLPRKAVASQVKVIDNQFKLNVYPNPAHEEIHLNSLENLNTGLVIYNILGENLFRKELPKGSSTIDIRWLPKGIYLIELSNSKGVFQQKLVKE